MRQRPQSLARLADAQTLVRRAAETRRNALDDELRALSRHENSLVLAIAHCDALSPSLHAAYTAALVKAEGRKLELLGEIEEIRDEILSSARAARGAEVRSERLVAAIDDHEARKSLEETAVSFALRTASRKP